MIHTKGEDNTDFNHFSLWFLGFKCIFGILLIAIPDLNIPDQQYKIFKF